LTFIICSLFPPGWETTTWKHHTDVAFGYLAVWLWLRSVFSTDVCKGLTSGWTRQDQNESFSSTVAFENWLQQSKPKLLNPVWLFESMRN